MKKSVQPSPKGQSHVAEKILVKAAALTLAATALVGCAEQTDTAPKPTTSQSEEAKPLTCAEFIAQNDVIPQLGTPEAEQMIESFRISSEVAPEDVTNAVLENERRFVETIVSAVPTNHDTIMDCYNTYEKLGEAAYGEAFGADRLSSMFVAATINPNIPEYSELVPAYTDSATALVYGVILNESVPVESNVSVDPVKTSPDQVIANFTQSWVFANNSTVGGSQNLVNATIDQTSGSWVRQTYKQ